MASGDPGRASSAAVGAWWRNQLRRDGGDPAGSTSAHDTSSLSRRLRHRRLSRLCVANISGGGVGTPASGLGKGFDAAQVPKSGVSGRAGGDTAGDAEASSSSLGGGGTSANVTVGSDDNGTSTGTLVVASTSKGRPRPTTNPRKQTHDARTTPNGAVLLPLWEHRPGSVPVQYALDGKKLRLLSPEEFDAMRESHVDDSISNQAGVTGPGTVPRGSVPDGNTGSVNGQDTSPMNKVNSASPLSKVNSAIDLQRRRFSRQYQRTKDSFLPSEDSVTEDYWEYARFRFGQRAASSCISVFATQQMLAALGLGATRRLPAAAAVNWVLKDGLGRLGKLSVTTNFGKEFDSDVKRFRFTSSVVYDASSLIEMLTPFYPSKFLLLATIANVGKSIGITTANVVRAPIQRSFTSDDNFAEITAKISAQQVLADNLGLGLAVLATGLTGKIASANARILLPLIAFVPLCSLDLYCIYRELKAVQLKTINRERGELIAEGFVARGQIPSFGDVAGLERLLIPARLDESALPLRIRPLHEACPDLVSLQKALSDDPDAPYILSYALPNEHGDKKSFRNVFVNFLSRVSWGMGDGGSSSSMGKQSSTSSHKTGNSSRKTPNSSHKQDKQSPKMKGHATLALAQHATSRDVMQAVLQVAHLRALPFRKDLTQDEARVWALSESKRKSDADVDCFLDQLTSNGWLFTKVLLSSAERAPYVVGSACVGALSGEDGDETER